MSMGYTPTEVPEEWDVAWMSEELRRLAELMSKMEMQRAVLSPQAVAPAKVEAGIVVNADGVNWNPGFGQGLYVYENGRWEPMSGKDFLIEVGKGNVPGHSLVRVNGANSAASTTLQDIWGTGGVKVPLQAAETMDIVSTDTTNDISGGTGANVVRVVGVGATGASQTEDVTLLATVVPTIATFLRVDYIELVSVGTYGGSNLGAITATATTAATVQATMAIGEGRSGQSHYFVPLGFNAQLMRISITVDSNKTADVHMNERAAALDITTPFSPVISRHHWEGINYSEETFKANHLFSELTDIWFACQMTSGTGEVDVDYDILLIDNTL